MVIDNRLNVINVSLVTIGYMDFTLLKKAINLAYEKGVITVAAFNNSNVFIFAMLLMELR
ncbi:hypothetical protein EHE19_001990 [Ruminiclostridium herbifermentans]|uniref:Uncharacterized protein n=1 Tax=Ruminiclostridium herbifermentans TaxID=2488810 RepID=A0A4U7JH22_9FIRM|nr:hypothetical protein [Ruminiclostridium herbifermentans]QNU67336.1 hypothetical protein EHE19_001990 [Ruminiclostridium herbifermentans]